MAVTFEVEDDELLRELYGKGRTEGRTEGQERCFIGFCSNDSSRWLPRLKRGSMPQLLPTLIPGSRAQFLQLAWKMF